MFCYYFVDALQQGASQFEQQAKSLKNKFWLQNLKVSCFFLPRIQQTGMLVKLNKSASLHDVFWAFKVVYGKYYSQMK